MFVQNGYLVLKLLQMSDVNGGVLSYGGQVHTRQKYGFGTYEWRARMGSTATVPIAEGGQVSGGVTGLFNYTGAPNTEIDFEVEGNRPDLLLTTTWTSLTRNESYSTWVTGMDRVFKIYKFVWSSSRVDFYVDGILRKSHTIVVPQESAPAMINHWGTNSPYFGGLATAITERYVYVDWFRFTPAKGR